MQKLKGNKSLQDWQTVTKSGCANFGNTGNLTDLLKNAIVSSLKTHGPNLRTLRLMAGYQLKWSLHEAIH